MAFSTTSISDYGRRVNFFGTDENETVNGGGNKDFLQGNGGADSLFGDNDADSLWGGAGNDTLLGGHGNDSIYGEDGNDLIQGGGGIDGLYGGAGNDTFVYVSVFETGDWGGSCDVIFGFVNRPTLPERDRIDLSGIDANATLPGNDAFVFIGQAAFENGNAAGKLRYEYDRYQGGYLVYGSTDADSAAEFAIRVHALSDPSAWDFVL